MAKKKEEVTRMSRLVERAKARRTLDVGAGGKVYDPYMSSVRGVKLPSLGMMNLLGCTALRDACTILIDGLPSSSKSSLAIDMFNWFLPYGGGGVINDCEQKGAFDIANSMLDEIALWYPNMLEMVSLTSVEATQENINRFVKYCRELNDGMGREEQLPQLIVTDTIAGAPSEETVKHINKEGHADRGHGGRVEALLWSIFLKKHEVEMIDLPVVSVFVNHVKEKQEQRGSITVNTKVNPGGIAQNYATTFHLRLSRGKRFNSESLEGSSYSEIKISCEKNSRGPDKRKTSVRKYFRNLENGHTEIWFDWGRNSTEFLAELGTQHPARDVANVRRKTGDRYTCAQLGSEEYDATELGYAIMADEKMANDIVQVMRWRKVREFTKLATEELDELRGAAQERHKEFLDREGE